MLQNKQYPVTLSSSFPSMCRSRHIQPTQKINGTAVISIARVAPMTMVPPQTIDGKMAPAAAEDLVVEVGPAPVGVLGLDVVVLALPLPPPPPPLPVVLLALPLPPPPPPLLLGIQSALALSQV
jgi:hypothetical protein